MNSRAAQSEAPSITHIITGLEVGGAERALYTLLTSGLEGPFRNHVISLMGPGYYGPLLEAAGIPVACLYMRPGRPSPLGLLALRAAVVARPADVVQGWMPHGNLSASLSQLLWRRGAALTWNIRLSLESESDQPVLTRVITRLMALLSAAPGAIIYNSSRSRRHHESLGYAASYSHVIPNGFSTETWRPDSDDRIAVRRELGISGSDWVIGYVGRGHSQKDVSNLFTAVTKFSARHPETVLIGVGRDLDCFERSPRRFIPLGQRADVARIIRAFDVLCLSSRAEGFPNVLGEGMASGVPCVTTDVGDARVIVGETGWVVPPRDPEALAEALGWAFEAPRAELQQRGLAARARIEQEFSIDMIVSRYTSLYRRLLKGAP